MSGGATDHGADEIPDTLTNTIYKRKRTLFLIFLVFQAPIVYLLYSAEITQGVLDRYEKWSSDGGGSILVVPGRGWWLSHANDNSSTTELHHLIPSTTTHLLDTNHTSKSSPPTSSLLTSLSTTTKKEEEDEELPLCPEEPPDLQGPLAISFNHKCLPHSEIKLNNPLVQAGGHYVPESCTARCRVAIIIPYRNREEHLSYFLEYMHPILQRQQLDYRVFIINQYAPFKFNRAKLMNVGYAEAIKDYDFNCFVFHDVDLILENDKALYKCTESPRHMSSAVDKFNYNLPYEAIFGGVTMLSKDSFIKTNGYSNKYWGWGGEDDDMYNRVRFSKQKISRYPINVSRYKMITHKRETGNEPNPQRFDMIRITNKNWKQDGLNSLEYKVIERTDYPLYTNVTVDLLAPPNIH